jgi:hypothetical protein
MSDFMFPNVFSYRYATFAAAMNHQPHNTTGLDSFNQLSVLTRKMPSSVRTFMLQDSCVSQDAFQNIRAMREDDWFYIGNRKKEQTGDINHREPEWFQKLKNVSKSLRGAALYGHAELFNLKTDLNQSRNLLREQILRANTMKKKMNSLWLSGARSTLSFAAGKTRDLDPVLLVTRSIVSEVQSKVVVNEAPASTNEGDSSESFRLKQAKTLARAQTLERQKTIPKHILPGNHAVKAARSRLKYSRKNASKRQLERNDAHRTEQVSDEDNTAALNTALNVHEKNKESE